MATSVKMEDYIFDETVTLTRARTGSFEAANTVASRIRGEHQLTNSFH